MKTHHLLVSFIALFSSAVATLGNSVAVDFTAPGGVTDTLTGFEAFPIVDGTLVPVSTNFTGGIDVTVTPVNLVVGTNNIGSRQRSVPVDNPPALTTAALYRDSIFFFDKGAGGEDRGLDIKVGGLMPSTPYRLEIWSHDLITFADPDDRRTSSWSLFDEATPFHNHVIDSPVVADDDFKFTVDAVANVSGEIIFKGRRGADSVNAGGSPDHGVFINAFRLEQTSSPPPPPGGTQVFGPRPYLSEADSPFDLSGLGSTFFLENFEDGLLNTPGVTADNGAPRGPSSLTDSVDGDGPGGIDGITNDAHSFLVRPGSLGVTFTFDDALLGGFPTAVGIASTDGFPGADAITGIPANTVEFFDPLGNLITTLNDFDQNISVNTVDDDRFVGLIHSGGIGSIRVTNLGTGNQGMEVDHLQYGFLQAGSPNAVPEPTTATLGLIGLAGLMVRRRRAA